MPGQTGSRNRYRTASVLLSDLKDLAADKAIAHIELGESIKVPQPLEGEQRTTLPRRERRSVAGVDDHQGGENVLIGIIDVQGFDFAHDDFQANGKTRFVALWDQGGAPRAGPTPRINGSTVLPSVPVRTAHGQRTAPLRPAGCQ